MNPQNLKPAEALELLEMPQDTIRQIRDQKSLAVFKEKIKKQRKILAKKYHPDKFPSQHIMQNINAICDLLLKLQIQSRPQPIVVHYYSYSYHSTTATTGGF